MSIFLVILALLMSMLAKNRYSKGNDLSALPCPERLLQNEPIKVVFIGKYLRPKC